jgi:glycosyltransferase involved in cell wall biosynthesis
MDKSNCLVSILCTAYNHEEYIRSALEGFVSQITDFGFEILVSDDASTDGTAAVIREFEKQYPELIRPFYLTENMFSKGAGKIYEDILFPNARGKYVALCEGDDYWTEPTKLQQQVGFLESHPEYSACVHNTTLHYCSGDIADELLIAPMGDHDVEFENVIKGPANAYHTSSVVAKKDILAERTDFYKASIAHGFADYSWSLQLRLHGKIRFIDKPMSVYRINSNPSAWSSGVDGQYKKLRSFVEGKCQLLQAFLSYAPEDVKPLVQEELLEREFELMYIEGRDIEQRREPYRRILKRQSKSYQVKNFIKSYVPGVQRLYRKKQGYID